MRGKIVAVIVALALVVGGAWGVWYRSGAHCRDAQSTMKGYLAAATDARSSVAMLGNSETVEAVTERDAYTTRLQTNAQLMDNVIRENSSCFSAAIRATVGDGS